MKCRKILCKQLFKNIYNQILFLLAYAKTFITPRIYKCFMRAKNNECKVCSLSRNIASHVLY